MATVLAGGNPHRTPFNVTLSPSTRAVILQCSGTLVRPHRRIDLVTVSLDDNDPGRLVFTYPRPPRAEKNGRGDDGLGDMLSRSIVLSEEVDPKTGRKVQSVRGLLDRRCPWPGQAQRGVRPCTQHVQLRYEKVTAMIDEDGVFNHFVARDITTDPL